MKKVYQSLILTLKLEDIGVLSIICTGIRTLLFGKITAGQGQAKRPKILPH
jgi:hypothetical protein